MKAMTAVTGRLLMAVAQMLALLAIAIVPATAMAETGAEKVYVPGVPSVESKGVEEGGGKPPKSHPKPHARTDGKAGKSVSPAPVEGSAAPVEPGDEAEPQHRSGGAAPGHDDDHPGGGHPGGGHHRSGEKGGDHEGATPRAAERHGDRSTPNAESESNRIAPDPATTDGGGSSPVLPILIAVAVLAALSIGVVVYRARPA
jgi:hypothetical protein